MATFKSHLAFYGCARYSIYHRDGDRVMVRCMCGRMFPTTECELRLIRMASTREINEVR